MCRFSKVVLQTGSKYGRGSRVLAQLLEICVLYMGKTHGLWHGFLKFVCYMWERFAGFGTGFLIFCAIFSRFTGFNTAFSRLLGFRMS